jgi:hypothetical protein
MVPGGTSVKEHEPEPLESVAVQDWPVEVVMLTVPEAGVVKLLVTVAVQFTVVP